jgi:hypothetical protein
VPGRGRARAVGLVQALREKMGGASHGYRLSLPGAGAERRGTGGERGNTVASRHSGGGWAGFELPAGRRPVKRRSSSSTCVWKLGTR